MGWPSTGSKSAGSDQPVTLRSSQMIPPWKIITPFHLILTCVFWRLIGSLADLFVSKYFLFLPCQSTSQVDRHASHRLGSHVFHHARVKSDFCINTLLACLVRRVNNNHHIKIAQIVIKTVLSTNSWRLTFCNDNWYICLSHTYTHPVPSHHRVWKFSCNCVWASQRWARGPGIRMLGLEYLA